MFELVVLGDWLNTSAISAGNLYRPTSVSGNGELASDEVGEVVFLEVVPPVTGGGAVENLENIKLILDDIEHPWINLQGTDTYLMTAPRTNIKTNPYFNTQNEILYNFGMPMVDAVNSPAPLLMATCPKFKNDLRIQAQAGSGGTSANFRIRAWGYRYKVDQLNMLFGAVIGGQVGFNDRRNNRTLQFIKPDVPISKTAWTQLPGGMDQAVPKIQHFSRYAFNANATTANVPYQFRYDVGNVGSNDQNMRFEYDRFNNALLIERLGVRASANLEEVFLNIDGEDRPKSRIPTLSGLNPIHFGRGNPILPASQPLYYQVPKFAKPYLVWNEIGYFAIVDNGSTVGANNVIAAMTGTHIEMGSR